MADIFNIRMAGREDLEAIRALLRDCGLPTEGVEEHLDGGYVVAEHDMEMIGVCGIEAYAPYGLMRSLAVSRAMRGRSAGRSLVADRIAWARAQGIRELYLLTIDADRYFDRFGFLRIQRSEAPPEVRDSLEFSLLCPETAVVMVRSLYDHE